MASGLTSSYLTLFDSTGPGTAWAQIQGTYVSSAQYLLLQCVDPNGPAVKIGAGGISFLPNYLLSSTWLTFTSTGDGTANILMTAKSPLLFSADNTYSIGALGATRPASGFFGTSVVAPALLATVTLTAGLTSYTAGISNSAGLIIAGSYESVSTPTYAEDSWTITDVIGTGVNGTSTLTFVHAGSTGAAAVKVPTLILGTLSSYGSNATATVGNGQPASYAVADLTGQHAAITSTLLFTTPASQGKFFRISWVASVTTVSDDSGVLGGSNGFRIQYTDGDAAVSKTSPASVVSSATSTLATQISGVIIIWAAAATAVNYTMDYTDTDASLHYNLHVTLEEL